MKTITLTLPDADSALEAALAEFLARFPQVEVRGDETAFSEQIENQLQRSEHDRLVGLGKPWSTLKQEINAKYGYTL